MTRDTAEFWNKRQANIEAEVKREREYAESRVGCMNNLRLKIDRLIGHQDPVSRVELAEARKKLAALEAEVKAEENAEWDLETTKARKEIWNAAVKNTANQNSRGKVLVSKVAREAGFSMQILKKHLERHELI